MGRRLALIVGINSYQDASFRPLHYAENDARAIAQWLVNIKGGNWSPPDVQHVQGAYATHELIESLVTRFCTQNAGPGDLVLVYFAGHAFVDATSGDGYLALANTNTQQPATAIHLPTLIQQSMGRSRAAHVVFILDCFQNGQAWDMRRATPFDSRPLLSPQILNALQNTGNRLILSSCRGKEGTPEAGERNLGRLTYNMILGLCGSASDPATKQITLQGLHSFLSRTVGEQQRPQLFGQESTPLVLVGEMPVPAAALPKLANTPLPPTQPSQSSPMQSASFTSPQTGGLSFQQSASYAPPAQRFTAAPMPTQAGAQATTTAQLSPTTPTTSGPLNISVAEQQSTMLLRQARHLVQTQNPGEAFTVLEQALQIAPNNVPALILQGQLLGSIGKSEEALYCIEKVLQIDANNALGWSVRAALLTNTGQYQPALQAIERSLELDPNNPESYAIKTSIMGHLAATQNQDPNKRFTAVAKQNSGPTSFLRGAGLQLLGLIVGSAGAALPILQPHVPLMVAFVLQSLGLAILCVNAVHGSYVHGFFRFVFTLFISILTAAILGGVAFIGGLNKIGQGRIYIMLQNNPALLVPVLIFGIWLAVAAAVPPIVALFAFIAGLITGVRRKQRRL